MKYIIKCSYCDKTYTVNVSGKATDFICSSCGGANGMKDVVKQVATPQILSGRGKKDPITDTDIDTIKSFHLGEHEIERDFQSHQAILLTILAVALATVVGITSGVAGVLIIIISFLVAVPVICYKSANAESSFRYKEDKKDTEAESLEDELNPWYPEMFDKDNESL